MQKKINVLSILLMLVLFCGLFSTCEYSSFKEGFWRGYAEERAREDYNNDQGLNVDHPQMKMQDGQRTSVNLVLKRDCHNLPDSILNSKTGEICPAAINSADVLLGEKDSWKWYELVLLIPIIPGFVFFVWMLMSFISNINDGDIFVKGNEWRLKWMSGLVLYWGLAEWICEIINFSFIKSAVEFENYVVCFDKPSVMPFILALTFLLFAEIFALGRKMKEDQEYMV